MLLKDSPIDEVESLTAARAGAMAGTEPSDGLRVSFVLIARKWALVSQGLLNTLFFQVVNALLTQLDKLKHRKNVLIMSTSNLPKAIGLPLLPMRVCLPTSIFTDSAFVDRADIIQYVDLPPREAIYEILRTCLCEMIEKRVVKHLVRVSLF